MRITFVVPNLDLSGGTRVILHHAQQLMRTSHDVLIVSPPPYVPPFAQRVKTWVKAWVKGDSCRPSLGDSASHFDQSSINHHVLEKWRPVANDDLPDGDIVIATWWETAEWVNALSPRKGAKVYFIQGHELFPYLPVQRVAATYRLPLHKIVVSPWLQRLMATEYGDTAVDLVLNSVDKSQFFAVKRGKQTVPTVGFLYSTSPVKGLEVTLSAIELATQAIPNLRIVCFGREPPRSHLPLPQNAKYIVRPPQDQIRNIYSQCDVWVTASRSDGFNLPAMEAMACRTPVIATAIGWPADAIKPKINGFLVKIDDPVGLATSIRSVLSQSDTDWRSLSANAYETVASSSWQESAQAFERALKRAWITDVAVGLDLFLSGDTAQ